MNTSRFEVRHLFRLKEMVAYLDKAIARDESRGNRPHRKYAERSALKRLLAGAEQLEAIERTGHKLLKVIDGKVPIDRVRKDEGPVTCPGCGVKGLGDCTEGCWVDQLQAAADELDQVLP